MYMEDVCVHIYSYPKLLLSNESEIENKIKKNNKEKQ